MPKYGVSCILTTFNQPFSSVRRSIDSVLLQTGIDVELIIEDDCSNRNLIDSINNYLRDKHSHIPVLFKENTTNVKTVLNIARGVELAKYSLVKTVDAGDTLYDSNTLSNIACYMAENQCKAGFGQIYRFYNRKGRLSFDYYDAPKNPTDFSALNLNDGNSRLINQLLTANWIPASAQFYSTGYYYDLLSELSEEYEVLYCQDFAASLALRNSTLSYLNQPIYWYEWGTGISTNGSSDSRRRLYRDHRNFYSKLLDKNLADQRYKAAYKRFRLREFIALKSPFYLPLLRIAELAPTQTIAPNEHLLQLLENSPLC